MTIETPGMKFALGDASRFLMVNQWPTNARRLFILTLPVSAAIWLLTVFLVVYIGLVWDIGYGISRFFKMWSSR